MKNDKYKIFEYLILLKIVQLFLWVDELNQKNKHVDSSDENFALWLSRKKSGHSTNLLYFHCFESVKISCQIINKWCYNSIGVNYISNRSIHQRDNLTSQICIKIRNFEEKMTKMSVECYKIWQYTAFHFSTCRNFKQGLTWILKV